MSRNSRNSDLNELFIESGMSVKPAGPHARQPALLSALPIIQDSFNVTDAMLNTRQ